MIKFRNPGTQYNTQIQVIKALYKEFKNKKSFTLEEMQEAMARASMMTAYGYAGNAALSLSNKENDSLNSTKMNAKMYAEVFRLLGWLTSYGEKSYPLMFTYIGEHVANSNDILPLYEQCVLGINNPQEIMDVKYDEKVRFFKAALLSMENLDGVMYKHELCLGPMSVNDLDEEEFSEMIKRIRKLRGSYSRYISAYENLCTNLGVKTSLPDNSTRLPIAFMNTCNWIEKKRNKDLYPPKSLECLYLSDYGKEVIKKIKLLKDMRLDEFNTYDFKTRKALIRLGVYSMLSRAGYDVSPVKDVMDTDSEICKNILQGKELLFSPYQTLKHTIVDDALGWDSFANKQEPFRNVSNNEQPGNKNGYTEDLLHTSITVNELSLNNISSEGYNVSKNDDKDAEVENFKSHVMKLKKEKWNKNKIVEYFFDRSINETQSEFYPFIAMLFRVMGFKCRASRAGDNGARWDAIIIDTVESIPIEIKSPTEEQHLSLKAIRQALENKIVLLSRETHPTLPETSSLAVGYFLPNNRAEVVNLIHDIKETYGYSIAVIDLKTILTVTVNIIFDNKGFDKAQLRRMEGFANAHF